jgi:hypothetical protein
VVAREELDVGLGVQANAARLQEHACHILLTYAVSHSYLHSWMDSKTEVQGALFQEAAIGSRVNMKKSALSRQVYVLYDTMYTLLYLSRII